ncbi:hypothetical protein KUV86_14840 [Halomonas sp. DP8Y7-3]|uniref:sulfotransferase family protein n=1 Tax=Halomonas sp. DP8Y7-3 TaxID=2859079 RepID=UPI001C96CDE0|nr:sulfotransferase family protein [Halomonas sp. DP8Y7-3]MBY5930384.1 hypothetical protein [Halomonas sp. DP8Y7-3]
MKLTHKLNWKIKMEYPQHKVFCIGLNKTGTTSLGDALKILGYRRLGWQDQVSAPLTLRWHEGKLDYFRKLTFKYDAFEDIPWCLVYKEMKAMYPNAKFILTEREDPEKWYDSLVRHVEKRGGWVGHYLIYGAYDLRANKDQCIDKYVRHNDEVREFFSGQPDQLLELNFEKGHGWKELCKFLGMSSLPDEDFPHSNKGK